MRENCMYGSEGRERNLPYPYRSQARASVRGVEAVEKLQKQGVF